MADGTYEKTMVLGTRQRASAPRARLACTDPSALAGGPGEEIPLEEDAVTLGRGPDNTVVLEAVGVSRSHARVQPAAGSWKVVDLGSTNGILVNDQRVAEATLQAGDRVAIGKAVFRYEPLGEAADGDALPDEPSDVTDFQRTVVVRPGSRGKGVGSKPAGAPGNPAAARSNTGTRGRSSNLGLWLIIGLGAVLVALAVALLV